MTKAIQLQRTEGERERDLSVVANLYARGWSMSQIAEYMTDTYYAEAVLSVRVIEKDIEEIQSRWTQSALVDFNAAKGAEIAKLNALEAAYWSAWEESRAAFTTVDRVVSKDQLLAREGEVVDVERSSTRRIKSGIPGGNALFLAGVERCIKERCKILGLYVERVDAGQGWKQQAERMGVDVDNIRETTIEVFMRAINRSSAGGSQASGSEIIDGETREI